MTLSIQLPFTELFTNAAIMGNAGIALCKTVVNNPITRIGQNLFWGCWNCSSIKQTRAKKITSSRVNFLPPELIKIRDKNLKKKMLPPSPKKSSPKGFSRELGEQISGTIQNTANVMEAFAPGLIPGATFVAAFAGVGSNGLGTFNTIHMKELSRRHRIIKSINKALLVTAGLITLSGSKVPEDAAQALTWTLRIATVIGAVDGAYEYREKIRTKTMDILNGMHESLLDLKKQFETASDLFGQFE